MPQGSACTGFLEGLVHSQTGLLYPESDEGRPCVELRQPVMADLETTITLEAPSQRGDTHEPPLGDVDTYASEPSPGEIDGERLPNVAARLDKFSVLRKLGSGGMGEVFAAYDEHLGRKVAIKLMRKHLSAQTSRFVREAQGLARLSHPNVVQIYEIGTFEGRLFLAMEFVAGQTLRDWLRAKQRTREQIVAVFREAGRGLAAAHAANLVHRDFKPDNVMVGDDDRVRVMDFGLVHEDGDHSDMLSEDSEHDDLVLADRRRHSALTLELTQPGSLLGTPAYMAPEQHLSQPTDARTDQFSFCVALWEALYGCRPFGGKNLLELVDNVVEHSIVEPPRNPDVPSWLRAVVERGLALDPRDRWASMDDLLAALTNDPTRRRRRVLGSILAVGVLAAVLVGNYFRVDRQREAARAEAAALELDRDRRCTGAAERIREIWDVDDRDRVEQALHATNHPMADEAWARTQPLLDDYASEWSHARKQVCLDAELGGPLDNDLARICLDERRAMFASLITWLSETDDPSLVFDAIPRAARLPAIAECSDPQQLARSIRLPADPEQREQVEAALERVARVAALHSVGKFEQARTEAEALLREAETIGWANLIAEAHYWVGWLAVTFGDRPSARTHLEQALFIGGGTGDPVALQAASALVYVTGYERDYDGALRWGRLGRMLVEYADASGSLGEAKLLSDIGFVHSQRNAKLDAIQFYREALAIYDAHLSPQHPTVAYMLNNLGVAYFDLDQFDIAMQYHQRALEVRRQNLPPKHPDLGFTDYGLARVHEKQGNLEQAIALLAEAIDVFAASYPADNPYLATARTDYGRVLALDGRLDDARVQLEIALIARSGAESGVRPEDLAHTRFELARVLWERSEQTRAVDLARLARDTYAAGGHTRELATIDDWLRTHEL